MNGHTEDIAVDAEPGERVVLDDSGQRERRTNARVGGAVLTALGAITTGVGVLWIALSEWANACDATYRTTNCGHADTGAYVTTAVGAAVVPAGILLIATAPRRTRVLQPSEPSPIALAPQPPPPIALARIPAAPPTTTILSVRF